jgi:hypothetical protein
MHTCIHTHIHTYIAGPTSRPEIRDMVKTDRPGSSIRVGSGVWRSSESGLTRPDRAHATRSHRPLRPLSRLDAIARHGYQDARPPFPRFRDPGRVSSPLPTESTSPPAPDRVNVTARPFRVPGAGDARSTKRAPSRKRPPFPGPGRSHSRLFRANIRVGAHTSGPGAPAPRLRPPLSESAPPGRRGGGSRSGSQCGRWRRCTWRRRPPPPSPSPWPAPCRSPATRPAYPSPSPRWTESSESIRAQRAPPPALSPPRALPSGNIKDVARARDRPPARPAACARFSGPPAQPARASGLL